MMKTHPLDDMMTCLTTFIASVDYISNPYLRGKLIELLAAITPKALGKDFPTYNFWERNVISTEFLPGALVRFYIDIEHTGARNQFYDKFNSRYYTALVIKYLWKLESYKKSFRKEAKNTEQFVQFVNMLLNDAIFLLDESLSKLASIRTNQDEMSSPNWLNISTNQRAEREAEHTRLERQVKTYLLLAKETIRMLNYMSRDVPDPFMAPELIDRVASMLNYFLVQLAGPKMMELKVKNPEKYNFDPKWLLAKIVKVYLNFSVDINFPSAVARDGRSYSYDVFHKTKDILQREKLVAADEISNFANFVTKTQECAKNVAEVEDQLGEIPDEFLDPILQTLMRDPVKLPNSKVTIDRPTITRHLLGNTTDPFNRSLLTVDMLVDDVDLKKKIDEFIASRTRRTKNL